MAPAARQPTAQTPTITLWGRRNSSNVRKVLWCAEEAAVPYTSIEVGGAFGGNDTPAYRALNPNGVVPTLQDGELVLWESNAIVRYLAARYAPTLYPQSPAERALGDRWMDWTTRHLPVCFAICSGACCAPPRPSAITHASPLR